MKATNFVLFLLLFGTGGSAIAGSDFDRLKALEGAMGCDDARGENQDHLPGDIERHGFDGNDSQREHGVRLSSRR